MTTIHYRQVTAIPDLDRIVELQKVVWAMDDLTCVPAHILHVATHLGGVVIGAYREETLVGFTYGFPARRDVPTLWSDMAAVHPDHQGNGIGFGLKQAQRQWALDNGFEVIGWSFDPLQRRNANFNLRHLGAFVRTYHVNFYGVLDDEFNAGMPTDRLEAIWELDSPRVSEAAQGKIGPLLQSYPEADFLLSSDDQGEPLIADPLTVKANWHFVEIPYDINRLKRENHDRAVQWQRAVCQAMQAAFQAGYTAVDFVSTQERCWYVLAHRAHTLAYNTLMARP